MTAPSTYAGASPCGTPAAASRHRYYGEPVCEECKAAEARRKRQQRRGLRPKRRRPRHGTISGYRNLHDGDACRACREAMAEYNRDWRAGRLRSTRLETTTTELISDVLETFGYAMTVEAVVSHVTDIKAAWKHDTVRRTMFRMISDGRLETFQRLGRTLIRPA